MDQNELDILLKKQPAEHIDSELLLELASANIKLGKVSRSLHEKARNEGGRTLSQSELNELRRINDQQLAISDRMLELTGLN